MEPEAPVTIAEPPPSSVKRFFYTCEDTISVFFPFGWWVALAAVGWLIVSSAWGRKDGYWLAAVWGVAVSIDGLFLIGLKGALEAGYRPFIPEFVLRQPTWFLVIRPVVAIWWLAHFVLGMSALFGVHLLVREIDVKSWQLFVIQLIGFELMAFSISHSAQLYFLLGVDALWKNRGATYSLWRLRFVVDVIALSAAMAYSWWPSSG